MKSGNEYWLFFFREYINPKLFAVYCTWEAVPPEALGAGVHRRIVIGAQRKREETLTRQENNMSTT
jgi:hypothetical protein